MVGGQDPPGDIVNANDVAIQKNHGNAGVFQALVMRWFVASQPAWCSKETPPRDTTFDELTTKQIRLRRRHMTGHLLEKIFLRFKN